MNLFVFIFILFLTFSFLINKKFRLTFKFLKQRSDLITLKVMSRMVIERQSFEQFSETNMMRHTLYQVKLNTYHISLAMLIFVFIITKKLLQQFVIKVLKLKYLTSFFIFSSSSSSSSSFHVSIT